MAKTHEIYKWKYSEVCDRKAGQYYINAVIYANWPTDLINLCLRLLQSFASVTVRLGTTATARASIIIPAISLQVEQLKPRDDSNAAMAVSKWCHLLPM